VLLILTLAHGPAILASQQTGAQHPDAAVLADFRARVEAYAALHDKLEKTLKPLPKVASPEAITEHQRALEQLISRERTRARRGEILTPEIRRYIRAQIAYVLRGPDGKAIRSAISDEETRTVRLAINAPYPRNVPRSTVPPQLLLVLPRLPEPLEYRFVGDRLVLLDIH